jgi:SKI/SNO/DAC family
MVSVGGNYSRLCLTQILQLVLHSVPLHTIHQVPYIKSTIIQSGGSGPGSGIRPFKCHRGPDLEFFKTSNITKFKVKRQKGGDECEKW